MYIQFHLISSPHMHFLVIPGIQNPHFDWSARKLVSWNSYCHPICLYLTPPLVEATVLPPTESPDLSSLPTVYYVLKEVFSKQHALSLSLNCHYDCCIDLPREAPFPSIHLFKMSNQKGRICRNTFTTLWLLASSISLPHLLEPVFFFVSKKDGSLRLCIDYHGLNSITVKNIYTAHQGTSLLLIPSGKLPSLPNWISEMHTVMSGAGREMSGKPPSMHD